VVVSICGILLAGLVGLVFMDEAADAVKANLTVFILAFYGALGCWLLIWAVWSAGRSFIKVFGAATKLFGVWRQPTADNKPGKVTLIIDDPELNHPLVRGLEAVMSVSVWAAFLYLLQPVGTLFMWGIGTRLAQMELFERSAVEGTVMMFQFILCLALVILAVNLAWMEWNYRKYAHLNRRKAPIPVSETDLAVFYGIPLEGVEEAQIAKFAIISVTGNKVSFKPSVAKAVASFILLLALLMPVPAWAATASVSLQQTGYDDNLLVTGPKTNTLLSFPVPRVNLLPGSAINLTVEPSSYINENSTFSFYLDDHQVATLTAAQLRAKPAVSFALPPEAAAAGVIRVRIAANIFVTNDICTDYQRGYLFYTIRNTSAAALSFNPPVAATIPQFFGTLYNGLAVLIPDNPSLSEITAGAWAYGILQKAYPHLPVKFLFESERSQFPGLPKVWVAMKNRLPANLSAYDSGIHLAYPDVLLITAADEAGLYSNIKHMGSSVVQELLASQSITPDTPYQLTGPIDRIFFGNNSAQEGILTVPIDFELYPALFGAAPRSLKFHLDGSYTPSPEAGHPTRLDVFFNRNLIYSEILDSSGALNKDIYLPQSVAVQARDTLSLQFSYPDHNGQYCRFRGPVQSAQIYRSSYVSGVDHLPGGLLTWQNVGLAFGGKGLMLLDGPSPDVIRAAGEAVLWLNRQLPTGVYAYPVMKTLEQDISGESPAYSILLSQAEHIPEGLQQGLPFLQGNEQTIYHKDDKAFVYRYNPAANTVLGQVGLYRGSPLIAITASKNTAALAPALRKLQSPLNYNRLDGNIFVLDSSGQLTTVDSRSSSIEQENHASWRATLDGWWYNALHFAGRYQKPLLIGLIVIIIVFAGKKIFAPKGK